ncbi:uncharacterized protein J3R85_009564 [Psidium guajava]|nr:uncharacterized protein J3R85_009564 [Psidium guajava]
MSVLVRGRTQAVLNGYGTPGFTSKTLERPQVEHTKVRFWSKSL